MAISAGTLGVVPAAPAPPAREGLAAGTRVLLEAPIPGTLLRLAAPNVVVIAVQAAINVLEAVYVGWLGRLLALQHARQRPARRGQHATARGRRRGGRPASRGALAGVDLGLGPVAPPGHRGRRRRGGHLLLSRQPGARRRAAIATQPRAALAAPGPPARGVVPRHPPGGVAGRAQHDPDESHGRGAHRPRRRLRHGGAGRLRHRRSSRISADPPRVRARLGARDDGRHQRRRGSTGAGAAHRARRRGDGLRVDGDDRARGRAVPRRLDEPLHARPRRRRRRQRLPARGGAELRILRPRAGAVLRVAGSGARGVAARRRVHAAGARGRGRLAGDPLARRRAEGAVIRHRARVRAVRRHAAVRGQGRWLAGGLMAKMLDLIEKLARGEAPPPAIATLIGFSLAAIEPGRALVEFEATERHANPMGTLHGGVLADIADAAMGMAYAALLGEGETFTTLELKINFTKPVWTGKLRAEGRVVSAGRTVGLVECDVRDAKDRLVAHATSTCMTLRGEAATGR